jgi:fucose permease
MSRSADIALVYAAGLLQGLALVSVPAAGDVLTSVQAFGLTSSQYGGLFLPLVVCAVAASTAGGPAARRWGRKVVLLVGLIADLCSMTVLASTAGYAHRTLAYPVLLLALALLGAGFGATLTAINASVAGFFPQHPDRAISLLHGFLGTGTALAPLIIALLGGGGLWWVLPAGLALCLTLLLLLALPRRLDNGPEADRSRPRDPPHVPKRGALPGGLWLFAAAALIYGMGETIFANWAKIYLHGEIGVSAAAAGYALAAFWGWVTLGRLAVAALGGRIGTGRIYPALALLMTAAFLVVTRVGGPASGVVAFGVAGLACSAVLPLTVGLAAERFPDLPDIVGGGMMAAYMTGFGIGSFGVGPLRQWGHVALSTLYGASSGLGLVLFGLTLLLVRPGSRPAPGSAP